MKRDGWVLLLAMTLPTLLAWIYFVALAPTTQQVNPAQQLAYTLGKMIQFTLPVLWFYTTHQRFPKPTLPTSTGMIWGVCFGIVAGGVILSLYFVLHSQTSIFASTTIQISHKLSEMGLHHRGRYLLFGIFLAGIHSLLEEYYWRWFVFGRLRELVSFRAAVLMSSLAFMGHHVIVIHVFFPGHFWSAVIPFSLGVAVGGAIWAWLYQRSERLYASWVSHVLVDVAILAVGYDLIWGG